MSYLDRDPNPESDVRSLQSHVKHIKPWWDDHLVVRETAQGGHWSERGGEEKKIPTPAGNQTTLVQPVASSHGD